MQKNFQVATKKRSFACPAVSNDVKTKRCVTSTKRVRAPVSFRTASPPSRTQTFHARRGSRNERTYLCTIHSKMQWQVFLSEKIKQQNQCGGSVLRGLHRMIAHWAERILRDQWSICSRQNHPSKTNLKWRLPDDPWGLFDLVRADSANRYFCASSTKCFELQKHSKEQFTFQGTMTVGSDVEHWHTDLYQLLSLKLMQSRHLWCCTVLRKVHNGSVSKGEAAAWACLRWLGNRLNQNGKSEWGLMRVGWCKSHFSISSLHWARVSLETGVCKNSGQYLAEMLLDFQGEKPLASGATRALFVPADRYRFHQQVLVIFHVELFPCVLSNLRSLMIRSIPTEKVTLWGPVLSVSSGLWSSSLTHSHNCFQKILHCWRQILVFPTELGKRWPMEVMTATNLSKLDIVWVTPPPLAKIVSTLTLSILHNVQLLESV